MDVAICVLGGGGRVQFNFFSDSNRVAKEFFASGLPLKCGLHT